MKSIQELKVEKINEEIIKLKDEYVRQGMNTEDANRKATDTIQYRVNEFGFEITYENDVVVNLLTSKERKNSYFKMTEEDVPMQLIEIVSDDMLLSYLEKNNLKLGFGRYFTESFYNKNIKDNDKAKELLSNDYLLVLKEGTINFIHYSKKDNTIKLENSERDDLSFCRGVYCFKADEHKILNNVKMSVYKGTYKGKYLECVYDPDPDENFPKDKGNSKEYVLLADKPVDVTKIK